MQSGIEAVSRKELGSWPMQWHCVRYPNAFEKEEKVMGGGPSTESMMLSGAASRELADAFDMLADTDVGGVPKFSPKVCREVAKVICCRTYATAVLELCHLIPVADHIASGGFEHFFWDMTVARASAFRALFSDVEGLAGNSVQVLDNGLQILYPDGSFAISFGRMPFLGAFLEFLVSTIGYGEVSDAIGILLAPGITAKAVSGQANKLSRGVYAYLKDHLPTVQAQKKFRCVISFMEEQEGEDFGLESIDDAAVLAFWCEMANQAEGEDFRTFHSSFQAFVRLRQALKQAIEQRTIDNAVSIGGDREAGEIDPDTICAMVEAIEDQDDTFLLVQEPPINSVKFLNRKETAALELLFDCGDAVNAMPLSWFRCEVFGKGQARITQAQRRKETKTKLKEVINDCVDEDYKDRRAVLEAINAHLGRVLLASVHILTRHRDTAAITLILALAPDVDLSPLKSALINGGDDTVVNLNAKPVAEHFLNTVEDEAYAGPELAAFMQSAKIAYKDISRQGFRDGDETDPEILQGFVEGAEPLLSLRRRLLLFLERIDTLPLPFESWEQQFLADHDIFIDQFERLYGNTS